MIPSPSSPKAQIFAEIASLWQWRIDTDPELACSLGLLSSRSPKSKSTSTHALDPRSISSFVNRLAYIQNTLKRTMQAVEMLKVDNVTLNGDDQMAVDLHLSQLHCYIDNSKYLSYLNPINRLEGVQIDLPLYFTNLPFKTNSDHKFYLLALQSIPLQIEEVIALLEEAVKLKVVNAKCSLDGVVNQIVAIVDSGGLVFKRDSENENESINEDMYTSIKATIISSVLPSFTKLANHLSTVYIPQLPEEIGVSKRHPFGLVFYEQCLAFHTTTTMSAREVHDLGVNEVDRISSEMLVCAKSAGYDTIDEYSDFLNTSSTTDPGSALDLVAKYRDVCGRISPNMMKLFHLRSLPRTPFRIVETPENQAAQAPVGYYLSGTLSTPGTFYINTSSLSTRRTYTCESLSLHEAIPGHHLQNSISCENSALSDGRRYCEDRRYFEAPCRFPFYTGYIEGWGLYCESLGSELGLYTETSSVFGRLSMESLRACRLVVDTGMHAFDWTLERATEYMLDKTAMSKGEARSEVVRYVTWPGQACAYKVGEIKIKSLRQKCEKSLGRAFDVRDFHELVLMNGAVALTVLEGLVDTFIAGRKLSASSGDKKVEDLQDVMTFMSGRFCKCCLIPKLMEEDGHES